MSRSNVIKQDHGGINGRQTQEDRTPPDRQAPARAAGSGEGSGSAMVAMVKKRREGENHVEQPPLPRKEAGVAGSTSTIGVSAAPRRNKRGV